MPLVPGIEYAWSVQQQPVYPVYNNKRKHDDEETMCLEPEMAPSKRLCQQHFEESQEMEQSEINHNTIQEDLNNQSATNNKQIQSQDIHGCMKDVVSIPPSYQNDHQVEQIESQNATQPQNMIMDLCDETYSSAVLENEISCDVMNSDYVPNTQQYISGDRSVNRVRCYCKPTWDSFIDLRPYVSDYY